MSNDGLYLHLSVEQKHPLIEEVLEGYRKVLGAPMWPPMDKEKIGDAFDRARERAIAENAEQVQRNAIAKSLRRVARAAEEYATALETGIDCDFARVELALAVEALDKTNRL